MKAEIKILKAKTRGDLTLGKQIANFAMENRKNKVALGIGAVGIFSLLSSGKRKSIRDDSNNQPKFM